jgi:hypothetical protein
VELYERRSQHTASIVALFTALVMVMVLCVMPLPVVVPVADVLCAKLVAPPV